MTSPTSRLTGSNSTFDFTVAEDSFSMDIPACQIGPGTHAEVLMLDVRRAIGRGIFSYSAKALAPKGQVVVTKEALEETGGDLMIVGHLPFLGKLVALLVTGSEKNEIVEFRLAP
jgi:hypothetical protein